MQDVMLQALYILSLLIMAYVVIVAALDWLKC